MTQLIDFHSHKVKKDNIKYLLVQEITQCSDEHFFVSGVHPWDLKTAINEQFFKDNLKNKKFIGIGEIGLDKLKPNFELQIKRFDLQVKIAVKLNINFLVIHNIKSSQEIIKVLKDNKYTGIINLHGFNSSLENFNEFNKSFKTIISLGSQYLRSLKLQSVVKQINLEHIFFETDDKDIDLTELYSLYASQNNILLPQLISKLNHNFTKLIKTLNIQH